MRCVVLVALVAVLAVGCVAQTGELIRITLRPDELGVAVPERYLGMSFEPNDVVRNPSRYHWAGLDVFDPGNCLCRLMSLLDRGVIRIGGMRGDTLWNRTVEDPTHMDPLLAFARTLGWLVDWQLRFAPYDPEAVAPSVSYLLENAGDFVRYFSIGNEPEWYVGQGSRPEDWGLDEYLDEYATYLTVLETEFEDVHVFGPEVSGDTDDFDPYLLWIRRFADHFHSKIDGISFHMYPSVHYASPITEQDRLRTLLSQETRLRVVDAVERVVSIGKEYSLPVFISETNAGVDESDTKGTYNKLASALNVLDLLFLAAERGVQGVSIHVGEATLWDQSPIQYGSRASMTSRNCTVKPLFYAMMLFSTARPQCFLGTDLQGHEGENIFSYAFLMRTGSTGVALINKDLDCEFSVELAVGDDVRHVRSIRLEGDWRGTAATLGEARIYSSGEWAPTWQTHPVMQGVVSFDLLPATAILLVLE